MMAFNNFARIVALSVVLASTLGSASPTTVPENAVDQLNIPRGLGPVVLGHEGLEKGTLATLPVRADEEADLIWPWDHSHHKNKGVISHVIDHIAYIQLQKI
jgi:hypothetical protein